MGTARVLVVSILLLSATACGGGYSSPPTSPSPMPSPAPPTGGALSSVTIPSGAKALGNKAFNPGELNVAVGETVTWLNTDTVSHTSTSNSAGWDSEAIAPGRQFSFTFTTAGTFPYHCTIHPGMVGTVVVR
jgi:plastocyanin